MMELENRPWMAEVMGELVGPTIEEQRALALQARYNLNCDRFDDTFLTGRRYGESYPANEIQHRLMMDNAREELTKLNEDARFWGVSPQHLRKAREDLQRYDLEGMSQVFQRFEHTLDSERYSLR